MSSSEISYVELASRGPIPEGLTVLRVLVGPPAAGKTTLCAHEEHRFGTRLSLDDARAGLGAGTHDQDATPAAVEYVRLQAHALLAMGADVTIDATSTTRGERATWLAIAREHRAAAVAVIVWAPWPQVRARNARRARPVPEDFVKDCWDRVTGLTAGDLIAERFQVVLERRPPDGSVRGPATAPTGLPCPRPGGR
uniref:AAA family ATPase n=1 Tax=Amycolatopsis sp. CA-096443 TaxID=3239919 RepID=UPI003F493B1D